MGSKLDKKKKGLFYYISDPFWYMIKKNFMKKVILTLLKNGYSKTKKFKVQDLPGELQNIFEDIEEGGIKAKHHPFWNVENKKNRYDLYVDYNKKTSTCYFTYWNRMCNGDAYGLGNWSEVVVK